MLVADGEQDRVLVVDPQATKVTRSFGVARNPYAMLLSPDGRSLFISSWSTAQVIQYNLADGKEIARIGVGAHPTEMLWLPAVDRDGDALRLAVACANTNHIFILEKDGAQPWHVKERLNLALTPRQPAGMTPSALSLSPDGRRLYVACSDANAVAVVDVSGEEESKVLGFVPTGWYPTSVRALPDGRLLILNGKGLGRTPIPMGQIRIAGLCLREH